MQKPLEVFPHPLGFSPYFTALQENLKMHLFELVHNPFEVLDTNKEKKKTVVERYFPSCFNTYMLP